jgi:4-hydroxy-3-polyprenylbenzoate decarboxylase
MPYVDLREFIETLKNHKEVVSIEEEVSWDLEAGAIMRKCCEEIAPAPFFQRIKDYPEGYRLFGNPLASFKRLALALDLPPGSKYTDILSVYDERRKNPIKPNLLKDGPCKENIHFGDDINLYEFPAPIIHGGDGGRYLCTWHIVATKDPDTNWVNWGMYRAMIHDKNSLGGLMIPTQHIGAIYSKYESKKMPMPFAIAIGPEPVTTIVATSAVPYGMSEVDVIGGVREEPLSLVKCETNDLFVPATAEIVIEGEVLPFERREEGPFGEYPGYQGSPKAPRPVYRVKAITHRNNPILTASNMGMPVDDCDVVMSVSVASDLKNDLIKYGFPITGIYIPPECCMFMVIISTKALYPGIAAQIAGTIWANKNGSSIGKVIVVEEDVDPTDINEVLHAWATINHPLKGIQIVSPLPGHPLIPYLTEYDKVHGIGANMVFDATWPKDWNEKDIPRKASFKYIYPKEIQEKVLNNWEEYGF